MIGRKPQGKPEDVDIKPQSFDDFELRLGDVMRGERATLGKSLLDVQRELRIKASYIAAIENCDPSAFDTPGFIAGYVRSYARYLGMDPEEAFEIFCAESGFSTSHGMSDKASGIRKPEADAVVRPRARDPLAEPNMPFAPAADSFLSRIEPGAIGSTLVLCALIGGISYGGWSVLQEIQRVQVVPVEQTPVVLSELDPLEAVGASAAETPGDDPALAAAGVFTPPSNEAFDRLYRPDALDVPVLVARDAPISTLDPDNGGLYARAPERDLPQFQDSSLAAAALDTGIARMPLPGEALDVPSFDRLPSFGGSTTATAALGRGVTVIAAREAWIKVSDQGGEVLWSGILQAGDTYKVPETAKAPVIGSARTGSLYFAVDGTVYGPAGRPAEYKDIPLTRDTLLASYSPAEAGSDSDLKTVLADLGVQSERPAERVVAAPVIPRVLNNRAPDITVVATAETWIEVTSPSGSKLLAKVLQPGETYRVPQTDQAPTIFSGNAGGVYFAVNGQTFGPYGASGKFGRGLTLDQQDITTKLAAADLTNKPELARIVAQLRTAPALPAQD